METLVEDCKVISTFILLTLCGPITCIWFKATSEQLVQSGNIETKKLLSVCQTCNTVY